MLNEAMLEDRLANIERAVADLRLRLGSLPAGNGWVDRVSGSVTDEAAFREALEYGRQIRQADRAPDEPGRQP